MVGKILRKVFGSRNDRILKRMRKAVAQINSLEEKLTSLSDDQLKAKTDEFKQRLAQGSTLDELLPEAFATVREAAKRTLGMRHYDVQMIGGMVLHEGKIAEMRTGEGKTLMATLPAYLNAVADNGVHIITVNDYLAQRDSEWMANVYEFLGLSVGVIVAGLEPEQRQQAYAADITYGTNNEFGFDYLRDNMAFTLNDRVQRGEFFAVVDEVDSILIDEARTPLIISGPTNDTSNLYLEINELVPQLERQEEEDGPGDYSIDEKGKQAYLTEEGHSRVEKLLLENNLLKEGDSLYDAANISLMHHLYASLRAHTLFQKDVDYIVQNNQVVIVDEFTGRTMHGRRWSDGLHQAVEAKEGVAIQQENQTVASITFQNYFRLYDKLSGMTGTADTEAFEFQQIYGLEVVVIPPNKPMVRDDRGDLVYLSAREKFNAIIADIEDCVERKQPVLVGTTSVETSEYIANLLKKKKIKHEVLNAKQHEREAHIIEEAGLPEAVTIATNMAGRGTDIVLGGKLEAELAAAPEEQHESIRKDWEQRHALVLEAGGLHIVGTERHESRRIDNQLRGRSGRQGDAGSSRFYLSLEDTLMRIFASDRVSGLMQKLGMEEGESIEHPWVTKAIENAQRKVEGHNFDIRKYLLEYDDVANDQRKVIYQQRNDLLELDDISDTVESIMNDILNEITDEYIPPQSMDEIWDIEGLQLALHNDLALTINIQGWLDADDDLHEETLRERLFESLLEQYKHKESAAGAEVVRQFEKGLFLQVVDHHWREHLGAMDYLRQSIGLRGYAQKNPKQEYKREAFEMFTQLLDRIKHDVVTSLCKVEVRTEQDVEAVEQQRQDNDNVHYEHEEANAFKDPGGPTEEAEGDEQAHTPFVRDSRKVGRNEPCPCGSGKKYKQCHGKIN